MSSRVYRILLVEDDENLGFVIQDLLRSAGYEVAWATDGESGALKFKQFAPHLSVLDVMLPKKDGYSLGEDLRTAAPDTPIIYLTARTMETDRIRGFQVGADDYVTKPFSNQELLLRVKAVLNRCYRRPTDEPKNEYVIGKFRFEPNNLQLSLGGDVKQLTEKESAVLRIFCQYQDQTVRRELILNAIWGQADYFSGRSLDVFVSKLRKYLKADSAVQIENVHGVGFRLRTKEVE